MECECARADSSARPARATHRCIECGLLCEDCGSAHARMTRVFGGHTVSPLTPDAKKEEASAGEPAGDVAVAAKASDIHCGALATVGVVQRDLLGPRPAERQREAHHAAQKGNIWCDIPYFLPCVLPPRYPSGPQRSVRRLVVRGPPNTHGACVVVGASTPREWRLRAAQQDARKQELREAKRMHRKFLPRMLKEYSGILEAAGHVSKFERAICDSFLTTADERSQPPAVGARAVRPASACLPGSSSPPLDTLCVPALSGVRAASAMPVLLRNVTHREGSGQRAAPSSQQSSHSPPRTPVGAHDWLSTEPDNDEAMSRATKSWNDRTVQPRFLDMPPMGYAPGAVDKVVNSSQSASALSQAAKQAEANSIVEALRPPEEREEESQRQHAAHRPSEREIYDSYYKHLKTLNTQVADKLLQLESLYEHESQDAENLRLHAARDMGLDLGSRARGTLEHAEAQKTIMEAEERWSNIQGCRLAFLCLNTRKRSSDSACSSVARCIKKASSREDGYSR